MLFPAAFCATQPVRLLVGYGIEDLQRFPAFDRFAFSSSSAFGVRSASKVDVFAGSLSIPYACARADQSG